MSRATVVASSTTSVTSATTVRSNRPAVKRLSSFVSLTATMRHLFICTLLCTLAIPALAQTTHSLHPPRQVKRSDQARNSARVIDWENRVMSRVMSKDPKVRAIARDALVQGAGHSLPLLRRFLHRRNEDLHLETFRIIQRIGPLAIPLLVELLRDERTSIRLGSLNELIDLAPDTE